ncbi:MAG: DUF1257 domain-containing protein [Candidatus Omnitrophica bacterium]|nr:DUF1257 domain-containing protein [Candidatus Omnitrophota bacterium]
MSGGGIIGLEIRCLAVLIKSIIDLGREYHEYKETASMRTADGVIHKVDLVLKDENGKDIGFEKTEKGDYKIVADTNGLNSQQLRQQQDFIKRIRQRYAYNKVTEELKKQGYVIAEEEKVQDNTIRLVARKWD